MSMNLVMDEQDQKDLAQALSVLNEEFERAADALFSETLKAGFRRDADRFLALKRRVLDAVAIDNINVTIKQLINQTDGGIIHAIKYYRQATGASLIDSKKYVENVRDGKMFATGKTNV